MARYAFATIPVWIKMIFLVKEKSTICGRLVFGRLLDWFGATTLLQKRSRQTKQAKTMSRAAVALDEKFMRAPQGRSDQERWQAMKSYPWSAVLVVVCRLLHWHVGLN